MISYARQQMLAEGKRRGPTRQPEHDEQVAFFNALGLETKFRPELKWIHAVPNGGHRSKATAGKLKAEGVTPGVSDIFVPLPANGFHGLYIEMKAGKNTLTKEQKEFAAFVVSRGYQFVAAWSAKEAFEALSIYLGVVFRTKIV